MKKRFSFMMILAILLMTISLSASALPSDYTELESIRFEADYWENLTIPYMLTSDTQSYSWELTFSDLSKIEGRCGSLIGVYNGKRSGYVYSPSNTTTDFGACVGDKHYSGGNIVNKGKNTITASYDGANHTYSLKDTLGILNLSNQSWNGSYALNKNFTVTACAVYNYGTDAVSKYEFVNVTIYHLRILEGNTVKVDLIPASRNSDGKVGMYDLVSDKFIGKDTYANSPDAPTGLKAISPTTVGGSDGQITGVDSTMEYSTDGGKTWKAVSGTSITGLKAGTVKVRVKANGNVAAGLIADVVIEDSTNKDITADISFVDEHLADVTELKVGDKARLMLTNVTNMKTTLDIAEAVMSVSIDGKEIDEKIVLTAPEFAYTFEKPGLYTIKFLEVKLKDGTYLKVTNKPETAVKVTEAPKPVPVGYKIIKGNGQTVFTNATSAVFASNAPFDKFSHVLLDGEKLAKKYYNAESGSTVITLNEKCIKKLSVGKHKLTIVSKDGSATAKFTVEKAKPKTGDATNPALLLMLLIACTGTIVLVSAKAKKRHS